MITIHRHESLLVMRQDTGVERFMMAVLIMLVVVVMFLFFQRDLPSAHDIRFRMQFRIQHQIDGQRVLGLRFEQFDIDLAGSSFITVDDGGSTFADLDRTHPWSGYILHSERLCQSTYGRCVLLYQLHIRTA